VHAVEEAIPAAALPDLHFEYPEVIEAVLRELCPRLPEASISRRALALLWLSGDEPGSNG
jgi:hypothetical protein